MSSSNSTANQEKQTLINMDKDTGHYTNIFIRDLPSATTVNEFKEMFRKYGPIHDCKLLYHPRTRKFEGDA